MINTQGQIFQKYWGKNKVEKSNTRKEKTKYKILLLYVLPIIAYTWLKDKILLFYVLPIAYTYPIFNIM